MPAAIEVQHKKWNDVTVLLDTGEFSFISGYYMGSKTLNIAMRWNGEGNDPGYPKLFGNPVWFNLPKSMNFFVLRMLSSYMELNTPENLGYKNVPMLKSDYDMYILRIKEAISVTLKQGG